MILRNDLWYLYDFERLRQDLWRWGKKRKLSQGKKTEIQAMFCKRWDDATDRKMHQNDPRVKFNCKDFRFYPWKNTGVNSWTMAVRDESVIREVSQIAYFCTKHLIFWLHEPVKCVCRMWKHGIPFADSKCNKKLSAERGTLHQHSSLWVGDVAEVA